jgi:hypothetical protein
VRFVVKSENKIIIKEDLDKITKSLNVIDARNSGIILCFMLALLRLGDYSILIIGEQT